MSKFNIEAFENLIAAAKESTLKSLESSPFLSQGRARAQAVAAGIADVKATLSFDLLDAPDFDIKSVKVKGAGARAGKVDESLTIDKKAEPEKNIIVALNWLVSLSKQIMEKINQHAAFIKFNQKTVETKAEKVELDSLRVKVQELEEECDEVRQRLMKGNLIISSPNRDNAPSLGIRQQKFDIATNTTKLETKVEVCVRMILQKTGVAMPVSDIVACHPLGNRRGAETTYILRVINRKPGSAWDTLAAALLTGKNNQSGKYCNNDINCYINFQLTKKKGELMKKIKEAKKNLKVVKYGADQNGRVTVKVRVDTVFEEVKSEADLARIITNPTVSQAGNFRQHRG